MKGIYQIKNLETENIYIGSSINISRRISAHKYLLKKGTHHCTFLQRAWNKYGEENLSLKW